MPENMKIIVYNYKDQFALSRKQVEAIKAIIPKDYFAPILEFHLTYDTSKPSILEYSYETRQAFFAFPAKEKAPEVLSKAVERVARRPGHENKSQVELRRNLKGQREGLYQSFVDKWPRQKSRSR